MALITARNLSKHYGRRVGVEHVDFDLPEGAIFGFLGPNGAGKTTTIRLLLGFLRPTQGGVSIFGLDCWRQSHDIKREVGYLPSDLRLYSWMTGASALSVAGRVRGRDLSKPGHDLAERFNLEMNVRVRAMSRGMRQKLGLILALAHRPKLLILDEPTSGLDPLMQDELANVLREHAARGHTVFFSSHTLSEVEALCDRIAIVRRGRIVADESLDDLRRRARRTVGIVFRDAEAAAQAQPPEGLRVGDRSGAVWRCELTGPAPAILSWAAEQPITDLTIGPPDLETVFRGYYRSEEAKS